MPFVEFQEAKTHRLLHLVEALGKDRVIGVLMPNGTSLRMHDAREAISFLGIKSLR